MIPGHPICEEFLAEHPQYAAWEHGHVMPGAKEICISADALGAFLRWCVLKGYAGPREMTAFLTDVAPHMRNLNSDES